MDQGYPPLLDNCSVRSVVPASKRKAVFEELHSGLLAGCFGRRKMTRQLSKELFWGTMKRDITQWSQECQKCLCHNSRHPMTPGSVPIVTSEPYEQLHAGSKRPNIAREYAREESNKMRRKMKFAYDRNKRLCTRRL
ncbi:unnamed protein product [Haemonchus placei]|uniref:RNA-directed DNA polymerase n=1 Tax=Haemonchus placei TaxID=6290 RepID=A0A0N4WWY1_HAEPC|nr:unnamed protein product [Haemonchus placei]